VALSKAQVFKKDVWRSDDGTVGLSYDLKVLHPFFFSGSIVASKENSWFIACMIVALTHRLGVLGGERSD
jgi:hypothetical protein